MKKCPLPPPKPWGGYGCKWIQLCKDTINNNGLMINPKLKNEMHDVIHYLESLNKEVIKSNSLNSYKLFKEKFSNEKIYPEYLKVIYKYSNN